MKKDVKQLRDGMFLAASRPMGETYMEPIVRKNRGLSESDTNENDGVNDKGKSEEIKCARVLSIKPKTNSFLERIKSESKNSVLTRLISFDDRYTSKYDANIQNIKRDHFSVLKYVLLFKDCIIIFESAVDDIAKIPNWSGKHGRYDEYGKSGQFSINKNNIKWHLENKLNISLTWEKVYEITESL
jgi:hypothetical protein